MAKTKVKTQNLKQPFSSRVDPALKKRYMRLAKRTKIAASSIISEILTYLDAKYPSDTEMMEVFPFLKRAESYKNKGGDL